MSSKLFEILYAFQPGRTRLSLAELTRITGLPHATVRRLVLELVQVGALHRATDGTFTVGLRLWRLGTLAPLTVPLRSAALPFMEDLYTALKQHVQLAVREGTEAVIVERLSASPAVDVVSQVGGHLPLHSSGVGKVLLAHAPEEIVQRVIGDGLPRLTPRTITDPQRLGQVLAECRGTGVATVREETSSMADSVASRIMDADGNVVAALSVVVRSGTVYLRAVTPTVIASALGISRRLGWTPRAGVR
ncbi:IclR family transcriptional regulator [Georgenia sp. EYE_87]|uniref:IclR family transcriptional regulator n=1 Tax=Georgenia sp. EYE_87 TaxID=2853448 RepID=UPI002003173F|nr:IclR family transcriptional regulator [Georgenia sp. EYE_87]MCK6210100.1 IclR family transcriptional regulator [Georgenia sp. EYE_87]